MVAYSFILSFLCLKKKKTAPWSVSERHIFTLNAAPRENKKHICNFNAKVKGKWNRLLRLPLL